jgi:hypothetical protein
MADYDIFREKLAAKHPSCGHALWAPSPNPDRPRAVQVGDVGFVRQGKFHRLFNALLPADHPSHKQLGVPEYHERIPIRPDHIVPEFLDCNHYCSAGVIVEREQGIPGYPPE